MTAVGGAAHVIALDACIVQVRVRDRLTALRVQVQCTGYLARSGIPLCSRPMEGQLWSTTPSNGLSSNKLPTPPVPLRLVYVPLDMPGNKRGRGRAGKAARYHRPAHTGASAPDCPDNPQAVASRYLPRPSHCNGWCWFRFTSHGS